MKWKDSATVSDRRGSEEDKGGLNHARKEFKDRNRDSSLGTIHRYTDGCIQTDEWIDR